jgi:hypothetical protein
MAAMSSIMAGTTLRITSASNSFSSPPIQAEDLGNIAFDLVQDPGDDLLLLANSGRYVADFGANKLQE